MNTDIDDSRVTNDNDTPAEVRVARFKAMQAATWAAASQNIVFYISIVGVFFAICSCAPVTEGIGTDDTSSSTDAPERDRVRPPRPEETTSTTSDTENPSESVGDTSSTGSQTTEEGGSSSDGQPALTSESSSGDESSSTGDDPVPCDVQEDCEPGQQCDPTLGYICAWPYDAHHCDESCDADDRVVFDFAGTPTCYCSTPCVLEADCDADQVCSPLLDRCIVSCANGPSTCPQWTDPTMVCGLVDDTPPYVQMCLYMNEGP